MQNEKERGFGEICLKYLDVIQCQSKNKNIYIFGTGRGGAIIESILKKAIFASKGLLMIER